jgi:glycosyltransferase involved in cell wall biosynthesis
MNPRVSIITVVFNGIYLIEKTIQNVLSQTYNNIEYIIIDGGSTDGTVDVIKKYASHIAFWSSSPDSGIYDAMNKGIDVSTGEYIWFINVGDEIYDTTTLSNIIALGSITVDVYYGRTQLIYPNGLIKKISIPPKKLTWKSLSGGRGCIDICHQSIIIRKNLVDHYDLLYKFASDHDWMIRALKKSKIIINTQLILSKYALNGFTGKNYLNCWKDRFRIVYKHYSFLLVLRTGFWFILASTKRIVLFLPKRLLIQVL